MASSSQPESQSQPQPQAARRPRRRRRSMLSAVDQLILRELEEYLIPDLAFIVLEYVHGFFDSLSVRLLQRAMRDTPSCAVMLTTTEVGVTNTKEGTIHVYSVVSAARVGVIEPLSIVDKGINVVKLLPPSGASYHFTDGPVPLPTARDGGRIRLAVGSDTDRFCILTVETGTWTVLSYTELVFRCEIEAITVLSESSSLITCRDDNAYVVAYDDGKETPRIMSTFTQHRNSVYACSAAAPRTFFSSGADRTLFAWTDAAPGGCTTVRDFDALNHVLRGTVRTIEVEPRHARVVWVRTDALIAVVNDAAGDGEEEKMTTYQNGGVGCVLSTAEPFTFAIRATDNTDTVQIIEIAPDGAHLPVATYTDLTPKRMFSLPGLGYVAWTVGHEDLYLVM